MAKIGTDISDAAKLLKAGEVVAIPTETVYGLAGNAFSPASILSIFEKKKRPSFDPLIAHIDSIDKVKKCVQKIPNQTRYLMEKFWPGPLTIVLPKSDLIPDEMTSGLDTVAVRMPNHPLTLRLLSQLDFPLAAPSANPFGYISPTNAQHVKDQLDNEVDYILDGGECQIGVESTIIGFENKKVTIFRQGKITKEDIERCLGQQVQVQVNVNNSSNPQAPGMLKSHYAPKCQLIMGNIKELAHKYQDKKIGIISFKGELGLDLKKGSVHMMLSPKGYVEEAARQLFSILRKLDQENLDLIIGEYIPDKGIGKAVNDRLRRAAAH